MKRFIMNQKGGALVVVLLVLVVLSILGVSLLDLSAAEAKLVKYQKDKTQAYYIAQSGADALATYIIKNPDALSPTALQAKVDAIIDVPSHKVFTSGSFAGGSLDVTLQSIPSSYHLRLVSIGTYHGVSQKVEVMLLKRGLFDNVIYAHKHLTLWSGAKVYGGDVQYGDTLYQGNNAGVIDGVTVKGPLVFPENDFPNPALPKYNALALPENNDLHVPIHGDVTIDATGDTTYLEKTYDEIIVDNNAVLTINLQDNKLKKIVVRRMIVDGTLDINYQDTDGNPDNNTGKLLLYVKEEVRFRGIVDSEAKHFVVYIGDYNSITNTGGSMGYIELKTGNSIFNGYIIGIHATVDVTSNLVYTGSIIAETVKVASNAEVHYDLANAPNIGPAEIGLPPLGYRLGNWSY